MPRQAEHLRDVSNRVGLPDGTFVILPLIEEGLRKLQEAERARRIAERGTDKKQNPHITDAGKCQRKVVLSLLNIEETNPPDTDSLLRFLFGHSAEDALAKVLEAYQGATYLREERVEIPIGETVISGRRDFDAVRVNWGDALIELKQTNGMALGFLLKRGKPNDDHVHQTNMYLHATGKKKALLTYTVAGQRKGEPMLVSWVIEYDKAMAEADIAQLADAYRMAQEKRVPPVPSGYTKLKYPCGWCPYMDLCFGGKLEAALKASLEVRNAQ